MNHLSMGQNQWGFPNRVLFLLIAILSPVHNDALSFSLPTIQDGTYIILDDYYSYKESEKKGVARTFAEFVKNGELQVRIFLIMESAE